VLVPGGRYTCETWEWDGMVGAWTDRSYEYLDGPMADKGMATAYDAARARLSYSGEASKAHFFRKRGNGTERRYVDRPDLRRRETVRAHRAHDDV